MRKHRRLRGALLAAALAAGRAAHGADAHKVKHFIRSFGTLGKTDALDAQAHASYGRERHGQLARWQEPDRHRDRLQVMVLARQDLVAQRQAFKNRLAAPGVDPVKAPIKAVVACLDTRSVYQRLIAHQKKPIVAITALMRKLIVIANAVVRDATAELKIDAQVS